MMLSISVTEKCQYLLTPKCLHVLTFLWESHWSINAKFNALSRRLQNKKLTICSYFKSFFQMHYLLWSMKNLGISTSSFFLDNLLFRLNLKVLTLKLIGWDKKICENFLSFKWIFNFYQKGFGLSRWKMLVFINSQVSLWAGFSIRFTLKY